MIRVDSSSLIAGKTVVSQYAGHGCPAADVPSTGDSGASFLLNDIAATGGIATDEYRALLLSFPSAGTFTPNEDGSFSLVGAPDGVYTFDYRGFKNGVTYGDFTVTSSIGTGSFTGVVSKTNLQLSEKSPSVNAGFRGIIAKTNLTLNTRVLSLVTGTSVSFVGEISKRDYQLNFKQLSVNTGQSFTGVISKGSLLLSGKTMSLMTGQVLEIQKQSLTLIAKQLAMGLPTYPIIPIERLFVMKQKTTIFIMKP